MTFDENLWGTHVSLFIKFKVHVLKQVLSGESNKHDAVNDDNNNDENRRFMLWSYFVQWEKTRKGEPC